MLIYFEVIVTLRRKQIDRHLADDILKCIFVDENMIISAATSLEFGLKSWISNRPIFVQIMAWYRKGNTPLFEPVMLIYWRIYVSLSPDHLMANTRGTFKHFIMVLKNIVCLCEEPYAVYKTWHIYPVSTPRADNGNVCWRFATHCVHGMASLKREIELTSAVLV